MKKHRQMTVDMSHDQHNYKLWVTSMFRTADKHINEKIAEVQNVINTTVNDNLNLISEKCNCLEASFHSLVDMIKKRPETFDLTPNHSREHQPEPDPLQRDDAWASYNRQHTHATLSRNH